MGLFIQHRLVMTNDGNILVLYIDPLLTEFAQELGNGESTRKRETLRESVASYIKEKLPDAKIAGVKIMIGSMLLTTIVLAGPAATTANAATTDYTQTAQQTIQAIRVTFNGQAMSFSQTPVARNGNTYVPIRDLAEEMGGSVWWNGDTKTVGINKGDTKIAFVVGSSTARVNGNAVAMVPSYMSNGMVMVPVRFIAESLGMKVGWNDASNTVSITSGTGAYTVKAGDSMWKIANAYGISVAQLQAANGMTGTAIYAGQMLNIPTTSSGGAATTPVGIPNGDYISYNTYTVQSGDNIWNLSVRFGLPQAELLKANNLTTSSTLSIGQKLSIPVHHIGVQATMGSKYGEYLDWWTQAQYVFPINKVATVTDVRTGRSFQVKRTIGANHSDTEPLTSADSATIKEVWGGAYAWTERAVIVQVDGRKIAASMASMPHGIDYVGNNNYNGHFDIHFRNSTRHVDGTVSDAHQRQIRIAAGLISA